MDLDRPHFRTTSTGNSSIKTAANATTDLFVSFTSRLSSSSSMKITKSILSPAHAGRDGGPVSLSSSISRRLRTNGSLKGGQASPFFTTPGKKRGCAFENPEPSSPKVTCIGQVRVKTRKKMEQTRSLSRRRSGEVSFRRPEKAADGGSQTEGYKICAQNSNIGGHYQQQQQSQECLSHRNQRWVHLPISVCEALRAIGAEFSCLFPCKSSCFSTSERKKAEKQNGSTASEKGHNSCGAVFARWLVSVNNGEGGKRREIELVVGGGREEQRAERMPMRNSRRHFFEDIEVSDDRIEVKGQSVVGEEETARVSICIPPKNALLLMRCRSDPMKMAALAHRFIWDAQEAPKDEDIKEEINGEVNEDLEEKVLAQECKDSEIEVFMVKKVEVDEAIEENEPNQIGSDAALASSEMEVVDHGIGEEYQEGELPISCEEMVEEKKQELQQEIEANEHTFIEEEAEVESNMSSFEALLDQEIAGHYEDSPRIQDNEEIEEIPLCFLSTSAESDEEESIDVPTFHEEAAMEIKKEENVKPINSEEEATFEDSDEENQWSAQLKSKAEIPGKTHQEYHKDDQTTVMQLTEFKTEGPENQEPKKVKEDTVLPECLLLMMYEPKLSMEVSKETWVCSTDFIKFLPERPPKAAAKATKGVGCIHEPMKRMLSNESKSKPIAPAPPPENDQQQPRSSCSLPAAAASMVTMIENKLGNAVAYEPFVLTRCKSEPVKTAAAKLMPESCFWNNSIGKLEPHRQATVGVGAAGVGF